MLAARVPYSQADFTLTDHHVALGSAAAHMTYRFDDASTFHPTAADMASFGGNATAVLGKSDGALCDTSPAFKIQTRCFPFELLAIAPVAASPSAGVRMHASWW